jgi:predicted urease superfamily metal-dependent hydrolase
VTQQWKTSYVSPVQKTTNPASLADFRPNSVTSILSRLTEKSVVKNWLMPAISDFYSDDQFGFQPTGGTMCVLVYLTHYVTEMLETYSYVRCLCVDFSTAFDVVDHNILSTKLTQLQLPAQIFHWLLSFLPGRMQHVKVGIAMSAARPTNRGTIQGSEIGPIYYVFMASDLRALSRTINELFKYASDTTLLVPEHTDVSLEEEFMALKRWVEINKMILKMLKTKEIVFHRHDPRLFYATCAIG